MTIKINMDDIGICKCGHPYHGHEDISWLDDGFDRGSCEVLGCKCIVYCNENFIPLPVDPFIDAMMVDISESLKEYFLSDSPFHLKSNRLKIFKGGKGIKVPFKYKA